MLYTSVEGWPVAYAPPEAVKRVLGTLRGYARKGASPHADVVRRHAIEHGTPCQDLPADWFFPDFEDPDKGELVEAAKRACEGCPVRVACLSWALEVKEDDGVWGGMSGKQRRDLRARQAAS